MQRITFHVEYTLYLLEGTHKTEPVKIIIKTEQNPIYSIF